MNTKGYGVSLFIQSESEKTLARKTLNTDTFHTVSFSEVAYCYEIEWVI